MSTPDFVKDLNKPLALDMQRFFLQALDGLSTHIAILDSCGVIIFVNAAWRRFADANGYSEADYGVGTNYFQACEAAEGDRIAWQVSAGLRELIGRRREELYVEYPCHSQEQQRWFALRATRFGSDDATHLIVTHENISEQKQREAALAENQLRLQALFDHAQDAFLLADDRARYVDANPAACALTGYSRDELLGLSVVDLTPPEIRRCALGGWRRVLEGGSSISESALMRKDRSSVAVEYRIVGNIVPGLHLTVLRDISERKRAEAERIQLAAELQTMAENERLRAQELARTNDLLTALNHVAARLEETPDPGTVMATLGDELKQLAITCMITLLEPAEDELELMVCYTSIELEQQAQIAQLLGTPLLGFRMVRGMLPIYAELVDRRRLVSIRHPMGLLAGLFPTVPQMMRDQILRLAGSGPTACGIYVPLVIEDRMLGVLWMWGESLREEDIPVVSVFASQVAVALEHARMFEQLCQGRERLRSLARRLVEAQENERRQLARELHDQVGQTLAALNIDISIARAHLSPESQAKIGARLDESAELVEITIEQVRNVMASLRPAVLDDYGLAAALRWYAQQFAQRTGLAVEVYVEEPEATPRLAPMVETALFRIAQEALANILKHAEARHAMLTFDLDDRSAQLVVIDDGVGFNPDEAPRMGSQRGLGLVSMRERAEAVGGSLRIESRPGMGTRLTAAVSR